MYLGCFFFFFFFFFLNFAYAETPGSPTVTIESGDANGLAVIWSPPTTGGVPTIYKITINDSNSSSLTVPENGSPRYTQTFANLTRNELYAVSVAAINCAGVTIVTTKGYSGTLVSTEGELLHA